MPVLLTYHSDISTLHCPFLVVDGKNMWVILIVDETDSIVAALVLDESQRGYLESVNGAARGVDYTYLHTDCLL